MKVVSKIINKIKIIYINISCYFIIKEIKNKKEQSDDKNK